jgi:hypothetical protein
MRALVVFHSENSEHPLSWMLKEEFKHCLIALDNGEHWIEVDGRTGIPTVRGMAPSDYDLAEYYRGLGWTVVETQQAPLKTMTQYMLKRPCVFASCVGMVQLILGISGLAMTPYSLYKQLLRKEK